MDHHESHFPRVLRKRFSQPRTYTCPEFHGPIKSGEECEFPVFSERFNGNLEEIRDMVISVDQIPTLSIESDETPKISLEKKFQLKIVDFDAEIERLNKQSLESTRSMIYHLEKSNMEGIEALAQLEEQDEQLDRLEEALTQVNTDMNVVQKDIRKMNKWMSCIPKAILKCVPLQKCSRRGTIADAYRKRDSSISPLVVTHTKQSGKKDKEFIKRLTNDSMEDEMESNLRHVSEAVNNLKHISVDINTQLHIQQPKLERIAVIAETSHTVMGGANKEVQKLIGES